MKLDFRRLLAKKSTAEARPRPAAAVAQLLLEIARLDRGVSPEELMAVRSHLSSAYGLSDAQLDELIAQARVQVDHSVSFFDAVKVVNEALAAEDKNQLFLALWQVAHADARVDPHEEALLRRLADLLHVPHSVYIRQKHRARDGG